MQLIDSHTHLYLPEFDSDRDEVVSKSIKNGVVKLLLPNIDADSVEPMLAMTRLYKGICYPMIGIHPTSIREDYKTQLDKIIGLSDLHNFIAIGETGIDLYWDQSYKNQQKEAFRIQLELSRNKNLPVVIHSRDSFDEIIDIINSFETGSITGVFHAFTGSIDQAKIVTDKGFKIGIGGIVTFNNSGLPRVVKDLDLNHIILETDSPYLAPVPKRGKRNESSYLVHTAERVAEIKEIDLQVLTEATYNNTRSLFKI